MSENNSKRTGIYIDPKLLARVDASIAMTGARSRSEFVCDALEHYLAVLHAQSSSRVLTPALESVIGGKLTGAENRISRSIFKLAVELAVANNILAVSTDIDPDTLEDLRQMCRYEVAKSGGRYRLEDAVEVQEDDPWLG